MPAELQRFANRIDAGKTLAESLSSYKGRENLLVLALPRGGVPVAREVANALDAPLDLWIVRKLGAPGHEELAMGALAAKDTIVLNEDVIDLLHLDEKDVEKAAAREKGEIERRNRIYRGGKPPPDVSGKTVIVVDDGLATGATMRAALASLRQAGASPIIAAAPVGAAQTCKLLEKEADAVVCPYQPEPFWGVGVWYRDFPQTADEEVQEMTGLRKPSANKEDPERGIIKAVERHLLPWGQEGWDFHPLIRAAENKDFVLIGEATHGTAEFYAIRAEITRHLIAHKGFDAVAVEADWPDAYRINRYVSSRSDDTDAEEALSDFERFPTWMWRNTEVRDFVEWLRGHNRALRPKAMPAGFYGLDLYSMTSSISAVLGYLDAIDPDEAARARTRYACFGQFIGNPQSYGYAISTGIWESCEQEVVFQLAEMQRKARYYLDRDGEFGADDYFAARQNAELVRSAEQYYRALFRGRPNTWNLRDRHMFNTLENLSRHLQTRLGRKPRIIVWAHNSHLGSADATEMKERGEINLGQLVHEKYGERSLRIGFSTGHGTVTAASEWDGRAETMEIRTPLPGSYESVFVKAASRDFFVDLRYQNEAVAALLPERLQRAIGVIYRPETERLSHYFYASLPRQFDFIIHLDETSALQPLPAVAHERPGEMDETYPWGM